MAISQVALSNTFNEFRTAFNDAANTVNTLVPSANAISANTITLSALTSGRVPLISTAGLIVDDSNLTYNTSTDVLTLGGTTDASSTTTGTLIVAGGVGVAKKLFVGTDLSVANNISIGTGQAYQVNGANVLSSTVLGSTVLASSLTSVGALASGSITSAFGSIDIGTDTLAAGNTIITGTLSTTGAITAPQAGNIIPFYYANYASFPSAATYHGALAHSHANGAMYYAHSSNWVQLAESSTSVSTGKSIAMAMIFGF